MFNKIILLSILCFSFCMCNLNADELNLKAEDIKLPTLNETQKQILNCMETLAKKENPKEFVEEIYNWGSEKGSPFCAKTLSLTAHQVTENKRVFFDMYPYFFSKKLQYLYLADNACSRKTKQICVLDWDVFLNAQDVPDMPLKINSSKKLGETYEIIVVGDNHFKTGTKIILEQALGAWKIKNLCRKNGDHCLLDILKPYEKNRRDL